MKLDLRLLKILNLVLSFGIRGSLKGSYVKGSRPMAVTDMVMAIVNTMNKSIIR